MSYEDIVYDSDGAVARVSINRPDALNACRGRTVDELISAISDAGWDRNIGVIVLTGTGERAFCTGGDQTAHAGHYDGQIGRASCRERV